jgi:hypothetical protein
MERWENHSGRRDSRAVPCGRRGPWIQAPAPGTAGGGKASKGPCCPSAPVPRVWFAYGYRLLVLNPGDGGAALVCFRAPWGGEVPSAGSISFCGSLVVDPVLDRLVMNVLDRYR